MEIQTIDASLLSKMFLSGAKSLESKKEWINELNVFPVPDGDTGTNMTMTIMSAAKAVSELKDPDMKTLTKAMSSGSLRGARGNSGVILSQLLRGFAKVAGNYDELTVEILNEAFEKATQTAYKAVMQPKEGTILTVARAAADKAAEIALKTDDIQVFADAVITAAEETLAKTPDMLPVLKQAGVVDSGGQGLVQFLKGGQDILLGKEVDLTIGEPVEEKEEETVEEQAAPAEDVKFDYCTGLTVKSSAKLLSYQIKEFKAYLESAGDLLDFTNDDNKMTVHVHTLEPGNVITKAMAYGQLSDVKVLNNSENACNKSASNAEPEKEMGFVSIATGEGLSSIFIELGCDYMIPGGQTMNPSTDDILSAVEHVNAKTVFVLPNNKNIILAANQAASICKDKKLVVIPTKTIPQGITALISFSADASVEDNTNAMTEEIANVKTGQVTYAVRDTMIDDKEIKMNDWMGMGDSGLLSVNADIDTAFLEMIDAMVSEDSSVVSIYWGEGSDENKATALGEKIAEKYPDLEIEISCGGQAVYAYIVSVE
ncbi:MAG: DAK2 domain-containing protein [Pseudobutyrivibrio sp.]|nr:DAK2 domain-containing protein [Pseudobutyrivibrio sp.]